MPGQSAIKHISWPLLVAADKKNILQEANCKVELA